MAADRDSGTAKAAGARGAASAIDRATRNLSQVVLERYPDEAASMLDSAPIAEVVALLEQQPATVAVEVLRRLTPTTAATVIDKMADQPTRRVFENLAPHRGAALLARLDPDRRESNLGCLQASLADELRALAEYPRDTAGGLMDPRVIAFRPEDTVQKVTRTLRKLRTQRIQDVFLVDAEGRLVGSVPLQDVVLARPAERLEDLVGGPSPHVADTAPREEVLSELERHRAASLPVVDFDGRLVGVLRQRELMRAAQQEVAADMLKMVGASKDERALSPASFAVKKRLPWLEINLLTAFLAASVVGLFEDTIKSFTALAVLLPVVAGQSGNTGAQSLAVTMRGLALREIRARHWFRVASKELTVATLNGIAVALTTAVAVYVWSGSAGLMLVIGVSMVLSMMAAGLAGASIPMILTSLRQDPAQSSSIILTTVTDVAGFFSFLGIATMLSGML